jgi:DNA-binding response OmpR family regulator
MRIGLLEDDPAICEMMQEMLEAGGHSVSAYHDGADILAALHLEEPAALPPPFDILFVDLILAGDINGEQVIHQVRIIYPHLPIVVVSAVAASHLQAVARRYPGVKALQKPFKLRDLFAAIEAKGSSPR